MDVISSFAARYERTREEELSLEEYLAECKRNPLAFATAAERMLRAIGEPQTVDTRNDPRLSRLFANKVIKIYPAFAEFYGMEDAIQQIVSYFRHAAQGLEEKQADPLPARPRRRRQELDRRAAQAADGRLADLRAQGLAGERVAARPVRPAERRRHAREGIRHPAPLPQPASSSPWAVKRLQEFGGDMTQVPRGQACTRRCCARSRGSRPSRATRTTRTSPLVGKVDIRKLESLRAGRPGRLQLFRRPVPGQPGPARVRRDVQGADQDAAPAADGHAGGQLQGHRGLRRDSVPGRRPRAQRTRANGRPSATTSNNEAFLDRIYIVKVPYCLQRHRGSEHLRAS